MPPQDSSKTLYLVDGTSQLFRAYFAIHGLTNPDGLPTNAVYGFATMLRKLMREERPAYLGVAFDVAGSVFRHEHYAEYKANRPPSPEDLKVQVPYAKRICEVLGIPTLEMKGYEADDVIATCTAQARALGFEVVVVASDKDLLQLVEDGVTVLNPTKEQRFDAEGVETSFGVRPGLVRDVLGLMGDAVDNVPGVPGVGRKTALNVVSTYGDVETVIDRAGRFVAVWDGRDRLVAAIDAAGRESALESATAERIARETAALADDLDRLIEVERDDAVRPRLEKVGQILRECDPGGIVAKAGQPGRQTVKPLASLKRELKALDRGSGKRVWYAIDEHAEQLRLSKQLITLHHEVPLEIGTEQLKLTGVDTPQARELFRSLGFTSLVADLDADGDDATATDGGAPPPWRAVLTREGLRDLAEACRRAERCVVATWIGGGSPLRSPLIGLALAHGESEAAYVPLGHEGLGTPDQLSLDTVRDELGPLLSDAQVPKVAHDLKRAIHVLGRHSLPVDGWSLDTMVAAFLLDASRSTYALERLAGQFLEGEVAAPSPVAEEPASEPIEQTAARVAEEACLTWRLAGRLRERLADGGLGELYDTIDGPLLPLLAEMEQRGVRIDTAHLARMSSEMDAGLQRARQEIHELAGVEFNVDSPKQLREVLFDRLGLKPRRRTAKSRAASTDAQTLEELAAEHPIAVTLLEYRTLAKLKGTYVDALPRLVDPASGRVHTSFHPTGAATGRLSSSDPNLQNIPARTEAGRRIREAFVPEDGFVFLASDYSQVELRVLAHLTGDPELTAAFRAGEDIHRHTAARVFDVHPELVTDEMRRRAKAVNFGILYGMSETRLAREQGIPRAEARRFIHAYFDRFALVRDYIDSVREQAQQDAVVHTLFGRARPFPQLHQQVNRAVREQALRAAVNTTVQGTAADLMKLAMLAVDRELREARLDARILLQVHDELLLEVPAGAVEPTAALVKRAMEEVYRLEVPLTVDQKTGRNWLEAT
jgi:DNA polymerase-1